MWFMALMLPNQAALNRANCNNVRIPKKVSKKNKPPILNRMFEELALNESQFRKAMKRLPIDARKKFVTLSLSSLAWKAV